MTTATTTTTAMTKNEGRRRTRAKLLRGVVACMAVVGLSLSGNGAATAATEVTTPVPGNGQTSTTLTWPDDTGRDVNVVLFANWSGVSASSATLDSIRVCAGQTVGQESLYILPTIFSSTGARSLSNKFVPNVQCNTWQVGQQLPVYAGTVYGQVQLNWYAGQNGAANVFAQFEVG